MLSQETATGADVTLGVGAGGDLDALRSAVGNLAGALVQPGTASPDLADEVIGLIRGVELDSLIQLAGEGSQETMHLIGSIVVVMQLAAEKGIQEAAKMASTIALKLGEAGYTIQQSHTCGCRHSSAHQE